MRLILDVKHEEKTVLGFAWLDIVGYGYDQDGILASIVCTGPLSDGSISLVTIEEPELSEDLMMNYTVQVTA